MMRNISFSHTMDQFRARTKTVTRRTGWRFLRVGDVLCGVERLRGMRKGEKVVRLGLIRVIDVRRELLRRLLDDLDYGAAEMGREGFPAQLPSEFVKFFCDINKRCTPDSEITRIEFTYLD